MNYIVRATDTIKELLVYYVALIVVAATLFSLAEHKDIITSVWWALVTATTIGYGDVYPVTILGKLIAVVLMHCVSLFIIPLLVGRMVTTMMVDKDKFTHEEQQEILEILRHIKQNDKK